MADVGGRELGPSAGGGHALDGGGMTLEWEGRMATAGCQQGGRGNRALSLRFPHSRERGTGVCY